MPATLEGQALAGTEAKLRVLKELLGSARTTDRSPSFTDDNAMVY